MSRKIIIAGLALVLSSQVFAQEKDYVASVSLGYVATSGNTDTQTFNTEFLLAFDTAMWTHNMKFQALGSSENSQTTAERYYLEDKSDYNLDEFQYFYGKASYTDDRFSGYNYQATVSAGYGRHLINEEGFTLQAFGGLGYRENDIDMLGSEGEVIVAFGENLTYQLSETSSITQLFETEIGDELTVTKFEIGLESVIVDRIATKISFQVRNISEVPVGVEKTDTQTSISLVYDF